MSIQVTTAIADLKNRSVFLDIAYTYYALFEWSLIISVLGFDAVCVIDFEAFEFQVVDVGVNGQHTLGGSPRDLKTFEGVRGSGWMTGDQRNEFSRKKKSSIAFNTVDAQSFAADIYLGGFSVLSCLLSTTYQPLNGLKR